MPTLKLLATPVLGVLAVVAVLCVWAFIALGDAVAGDR